MSNFSGIPRPFGILDAKRAREEESRLREQATSARNTSSTTVGSGGRLDVDGGDLTVQNGGNASVKDGGRFLVEGGGSMEITDDGVVKVVGSTVDDLTDAVMVAEAALSTEEIHHTSSGVTTRSPGLFFKTERFSGGKVSSFWGDDVGITSGMRLVDYGPLVEAGVYKNTASRVSPSSAGLYASAFFSTTPDIADQRSQCYIEAYPDAIVAELFSVALGRVGGINVSMTDPKLRLYGRDGVDVKGPFTVDGAPVGGAVDSVAGKTGAVTLVKADVGLGNVDNTSDASKPVSNATATALSGKASTAVATTTVNGLMASTDKSKLDNSTASATALRLIQRDSLGRAQVADPAIAADIATKGYVDSPKPLLIFRRAALLTLASGYLGNVPWDLADEDATLYSADPGRMYATIAGVYAFSCFITIQDPTKTGNRQVVVKKNGTNYTGIAGPPNTANFAGSFSAPIRMAAGDYLEVVAYQNSGANATLYASSAGNSYNNASMQWLRP